MSVEQNIDGDMVIDIFGTFEGIPKWECDETVFQIDGDKYAVALILLGLGQNTPLCLTPSPEIVFTPGDQNSDDPFADVFAE